MKKVTQESLGFKVPVGFYESEAEADQAAGKQGALLDEANKNLWYRGAAPEAREAICTTVETLTGVPRKLKPVMEEVEKDGQKVTQQAKDNDGNELWDFDEREAVYVNRVAALWEKDNAGKKFYENFQDAITAAINALNDGQGINVDIKRAERKPAGPKKLPAKYLEKATQLLGEGGKIDLFAKDYRKLFDKELDRSSAEKVGWAFKEFIDERARREGEKY